MKATWNGHVIAESNDTIMIEGNHYFPPDSVKPGTLSDSDTQYHCPWKGDAKYYNITVDSDTKADGAWCYPEPKETAITLVGKNFSKFVAFDHSIEVAK
jgi:uncharacterized protein (DUF427 family)